MSDPPLHKNGRNGRVESLNRSDGGVPRLPVPTARITERGLEGDSQIHLRIHGGPDRAVVLYSLEVIQALAKEGHPIGIGTTGENLTVAGIDWRLVGPGSEFVVGRGAAAVRLRITKFATPCSEIKGSFINADVSRVDPALHPGWTRVCARVLQTGVVRVGDPVVLLCSR